MTTDLENRLLRWEREAYLASRSSENDIRNERILLLLQVIRRPDAVKLPAQVFQPKEEIKEHHSPAEET